MSLLVWSHDRIRTINDFLLLSSLNPWILPEPTNTPNFKLFIYLFYFCSYFRAMANGETPPVKDRLELATATQKTDTGLTPGLLRVLNKQVSSFPFTSHRNKYL